MTFYSDISLFWILPLALLLAGIVYIYYRKQEVYISAPKIKRIALLVIRTMVLTILFLLLFNVLTERQVSRSEKPLFITLVDNSSSMLNYKDRNNVEKGISSYLNELKELYGDQFELKTFVIADSIKEGEVSLDENKTDLNQAFDYLFNNYYSRNIGGITLISDGNYNSGIDPIYSAERIKLTPVFTLGVGDTILKKDQLIRSVNVNTVAFLDNDFPVEVTIEGKRLKGKRSNVSIRRSGKEIASQDITFDNNHDFKSISFLLKADVPGFNSFEVYLEVIDGEQSVKNNSERFYIEVIDTRSKVLLLAEAPHPDIAAIRSAIEGNERLIVESTTIDKFDNNIKDVELVLLHGVSGQKAAQINEMLIDKKIPCWYFYTSNSDGAKFASILKGASIPVANRFDNVQAYESSSFLLFERSETIAELLHNAPPVQVRFGEFKGNLGDILLKQRIGTVRKDDAVLSYKELNGRKCGFFFGEGIWRWKLNEFVRTGENKGFNELIQLSVQYLTVKRNTEPLRIFLPEEFNSDKEILIRAEFYNEALEAITQPEIDLVLTSDNGKKFNYRFSKGVNDYSVNLGKHKPGLYSFEAKTNFNGKSYTKTGSFAVEEITVEAMNTHSDFGLLRKLSVTTGGQFDELKDYKKQLNDLSKRNDTVSVNYTESEFASLIDLIWILVLMIVLLATEWFVRRYSGSY